MKTETALFVYDLSKGNSMTIVTNGQSAARYALRSIAEDIDLEFIKVDPHRYEISYNFYPWRASIASFRSITDIEGLHGRSGKVFAQNVSILNKLQYEGFRDIELWPAYYPDI